MWTQEAHGSLEAHVSEGRSLSYLMKKTFVLAADKAGCLSKSNLPFFLPHRLHRAGVPAPAAGATGRLPGKGAT